ncbi:wax ester/triacylglycerol synthase family O-acyltransferase [Nocardia huaxiensis]|uniref:Diacylglycerol O-acyltransferase n=1 Tax=Nocardia huaxiensis TaxID=2755382 RepID=A0A7D6VB18_9NOCA|nr:wax ester/triacylglycerol synthase family O-acyltransferase [Nocardia huaxiensis]QLY28557.1 wax ester/triacylglycerol synthase family O-acyltransferase [Nocardia huaxiensis]UFS97974.1 wax ester/triacylglycerol synthase family O-acyltransferase [Nocardia huaxiensis]
MTELRPLDAGFLELEDSDQHISLGIGAAAILDGPPPPRHQFLEVMRVRAGDNPRLRQRLRRATLDLSAPVWEDDPAFDPAHHIRWTALPAPGDEAALSELLATELTERLDRDHPLWQCVVVEGLSGDRWALLVKAHHSLVDGVSGITLLAQFCDDLPTAPGPDESGDSQEKPRSAGGLDWIARSLLLPVELPRQAIGMARSLIPVVRAAVTPTAGTSLNGPIGRQRRYIAARTSLLEFREIGAAFGATVNDVVLTVIASGYRSLLLARGEDPTRDKLRILVPVSMRSSDAKYVMDNRVSAMLPHLPIDIADPVERLRAIHDNLTAHKSRGEAQAEKAVLGMSSWLPFAPLAWSLRLLSHLPQRGVTAIATNIPGPRRELSVHGRRILELWPVVPIAMRLRTAVAILSYVDQLTFGITGDYDGAPDIELIADGIHSATAELLAAARSGKPARTP